MDNNKLPSQWICTDPDCAQWRRQVGEDSFELVQVIELPDDFAVAHGIIYLSDYKEEEKQMILGFFDYSSWNDLVEKSGSVAVANQIFAECAFESEWAEYISDIKLRTFKEAEAKVKEITKN